MNKKIAVLLVDDHGLVRETLASWLRTSPDVHVVGTAPDAQAAIAVAQETRPDVVLTDIDMPGLSCFEAANTLRSTLPDIRIIFVSAFWHDHYIEQALAVGASGYVTKSQPAAAVLNAIRRVASGAAYFSPEVEGRIVVDADGIRLARAPRARMATLSAREIEVLGYLAQGHSKKQIAQTTHLSERTVNRHCTNLMTKLDIHDRVELARFAIREGVATV